MYIVTGCNDPLRIRAMPDASNEDLSDVLPLTPAFFHVLVALGNDVRHGYAIAREIEEVTDGTVKMGPGTLYGSLQRLRDHGLIEEAPDPGREGLHADRRRYYRLTPRGRAALRADSDRLGRALELARARLP